MDSDLSRLCAIPGDHDLTLGEVADVLQVSESYVARCTSKPGQQRSAGKPLIEAKRYCGRGRASRRVRYPRAAIVRYLVDISTGDKSVILAAIAAQCPQHLPAAVSPPDSMHQAPGSTPPNLIPMTMPPSLRTPGPRSHSPKPEPERPGQLLLFTA